VLHLAQAAPQSVRICGQRFVAGCPWSSHPAPLAAASWPRALAASRLLLSAVAWHQAREAPLKVRQAPREAAWAWLGVFLLFLVFCLPTMNGIVLAYFTKELQRDVGLTIAQYGLLTGARPQASPDGRRSDAQCRPQCCMSCGAAFQRQSALPGQLEARTQPSWSACPQRSQRYELNRLLTKRSSVVCMAHHHVDAAGAWQHV